MRTLDARRDQLTILKLERRTMRPLAEVLLSDAAPAAKRAAIAGAALALASLAGAPAAYAQTLGMEPSAVSSPSAFARAQDACDHLLDCVNSGADRNTLSEGLSSLYSVVDAEHERFARLARQKDARLLQVDEEGVGTGGEDKKLQTWLNQLSLQER